ncbi:MAG: hypothetical protein Kow00124_02900 [Anaerolineae bacterium]
MDLNFVSDPGLIPRPREEIRIEELIVAPHETEGRLRVEMVLTPFMPQDRPNLEIVASGMENDVVGSASVIGALSSSMAITLHLRRPPAGGVCTVTVTLYYEEDSPQHTASQTVRVG